MVVPVAHAGHWVANLLYAAPVIVIVAALVRQSRKDRRAEREERERTPPGPGTPEP